MMEFIDQLHGGAADGGHVDSRQSGPISPQPSGRKLAPIMALVSPEEFRRLGVVPVAYDQSARRLKLIYSAMLDSSQRRELISRLPDISFEWHSVDGKVFDTLFQRVATEYASPAVSPEVGVVDYQAVPETPQPAPVSWPALEQLAAPADRSVPHSSTPSPQAVPGHKAVLFVTPSGSISQHLMFALNAERCTPVIARSLDQASQEIDRQPIVSVFVHENLHGRRDEFVQQLQLARPDLPVRYYRSDAALLMNETRNQTTFDLVRQNLTLFNRLHERRGSVVSDHASAVARMADRMAMRLNLSDDFRLLVITAAYLHNLGEENLRDASGLPPQEIIRLSASRLESWEFMPSVVRLLRQMYQTESRPGTNIESIETRGAAILTTADAFYHLWPDAATVNRQIDLVQAKLEQHLGKAAGRQVMSTLIDVLRDDCTARMLRPGSFSLHFFSTREPQPDDLIEALRAEGFRVTTSSRIDVCAQSCVDARVDLLVVRDSGSVEDAYDTLMSLALRGVAVRRLHTVLLLNEGSVTGAMRLLAHGVEDILPASARCEAIVTKLMRIKNRVDEQSRYQVTAREQLGTHGSLKDMGLIDILESFRTNRRTARISVTASGKQLTVYLDRGRVVAAECDESQGTGTLLRAVAWRQGIWSIESIDPSELPPANVDEPIDAVLIEACTRLDQAVKDEPVLQGEYPA